MGITTLYDNVMRPGAAGAAGHDKGGGDGPGAGSLRHRDQLEEVDSDIRDGLADRHGLRVLRVPVVDQHNSREPRSGPPDVPTGVDPGEGRGELTEGRKEIRE